MVTQALRGWTEPRLQAGPPSFVDATGPVRRPSLPPATVEPMTALPQPLRDLIDSGTLAHLSTVGPDGGPQVTVIWIGLEGDDVVSGHMGWYAKLANIDRNPRVALSLEGRRDHGAFLNPYAVLYADATVEPTDGAWDLLDRLAKVYLNPEATFPAPKGPGYIVRYRIRRIGGVGPWAPHD